MARIAALCFLCAIWGAAMAVSAASTGDGGAVVDTASVVAGSSGLATETPPSTAPTPPGSDFSNGEPVSFAFRGFRLAGHPRVPEDELADLFAAYSNRPITFEELQTLVLAIEALHHQLGYTLTLAYLPRQVVEDGIVAIAVMPGVYGGVRLDNRSRLRERVARRALAQIRPGEPVHTPTLDGMIGLLNDLPGVSAWYAFSAGSKTGETDLLVHLEDEKRWRSDATLDVKMVDGQTAAGLSATLASLNPLGLADEASLTLSTNGTSRAGSRVAYRFPLGPALEYRLLASAAVDRYQLDGELAGLGGGGSASFGLQLERELVLYRGVAAASVALEHRAFFDELAGSRTSSRSRAVQGSLRWQSDGAGERGRTGTGLGSGAPAGELRWEGDLRVGHFALGTPEQRLIDELTARTQGRYAVIRMRGDWTRVVGDGRLAVSLSGQVANRNLPSFEKFQLAGGRGVRALSGARTSGDDGWALRLEYTAAPVDAGDFPGRVQFVPFVDMGGITYNKRPWDGTGRGGRLAYGAGIEARWAVVRGFDVRMHTAWLVHDTVGLVPPGDWSGFGLSMSVSF